MPLSVDKIIRRAKRHIRKGESALAVPLYQQVLETYPQNKRAIAGLKALRKNTRIEATIRKTPPEDQLRALKYLIALSEQGKQQEVLKEGAALAQRFPTVAEFPYIVGNVNMTLQHFEQAVIHFTHAVELRPEFFEAHYNLGIVYAGCGKLEEAVACYTQAIQIKPEFMEAHSNLGVVLRDLGKLNEAIASYRAALQINPDSAQTHNNLGIALQDKGELEKAIANYKAALAIKPDYAEAHYHLGNAFRETSKPEKAIACYHASLQLAPENVAAHNNLGNAFKDLGRNEEAVLAYTAALQVESDSGTSHWNLSFVKKYVTDDPHIEQMLALLKKNTNSVENKLQLNFALGKAFADIGRHDEAFAYFLEANRLRKNERGYDISSDRALFADIYATFSKQVPVLSRSAAPEEEGRHQPVFIVGMPRSGTTLVEQILASHSHIFGAGELTLLGKILGSLKRRSLDVETEHLQLIRAAYLQGLDELGVSEKFVANKLPLNFRWIGFVLSAIPEAKIIHMQRDARATCWSIFKHYFPGPGNGYADNLQDIAEYYKLYTEMMAFWHAKFPGRVYDLRYETLTEQQEDQTRQLLEYLGLDWEDQCLDFHKTSRVVRSASAQQVRQKMYTGSSEEWRKYEEHLGPMLDALDDV